MYYCLTLSERTGTKVSDSTSSEFTFNDIFLNDQRVVFKEDGVTVSYTVDRDGNVDTNPKDLIKIYCYAGSSADPVQVEDFPPNNPIPTADWAMPNWNASMEMNDLIFAIVRIDYSKEKNITSLPTVTFKITNSMTKPGDCLYDYMTNTRYGAGIAVEDIYVA